MILIDKTIIIFNNKFYLAQNKASNRMPILRYAYL